MVTGFQLAWHPHAFGLGQDESALRRIATDSRRIVVATAVGITPIAVFAPELVRIIGGAPYLPAVPAVGLLLIQSLAFALYLVATMGSALVHRMRDLGMAATVGAIIGVAVNVPFARLWGSTGTAGAVAIGQAVSVAIAVYLSAKARPLPVPWVRIGFVSALTAAVIAAATIPNDIPLGARVALGVLFLIGLWVEGGLRELLRYVRLRLSRANR
jgi:O-antigen/teichoic acid export membrane protein